MAAVPSPRGIPPRPIAEALLAFEAQLRDAAGTMDASRAGDPADAWGRCRDAIEEALARAERLRLAAPELDYEGVVTVIAELIAPLDAFADAERTFAHRRRGRRER